MESLISFATHCLSEQTHSGGPLARFRRPSGRFPACYRSLIAVGHSHDDLSLLLAIIGRSAFAAHRIVAYVVWRCDRQHHAIPPCAGPCQFDCYGPRLSLAQSQHFGSCTIFRSDAPVFPNRCACLPAHSPSQGTQWGRFSLDSRHGSFLTASPLDHRAVSDHSEKQV